VPARQLYCTGIWCFRPGEAGGLPRGIPAAEALVARKGCKGKAQGAWQVLPVTAGNNNVECSGSKK